MTRCRCGSVEMGPGTTWVRFDGVEHTPQGCGARIAARGASRCGFPNCRAPGEYPGHTHPTGSGDELVTRG